MDALVNESFGALIVAVKLMQKVYQLYELYKLWLNMARAFIWAGNNGFVMVYMLDSRFTHDQIENVDFTDNYIGQPLYIYMVILNASSTRSCNILCMETTPPGTNG